MLPGSVLFLETLLCIVSETVVCLSAERDCKGETCGV